MTYDGARAVGLPLLLALATLLAPSAACGDGFRNPFQGAAAIAQGNAFAAQADDPSAVFYNPAGMTQLRGAQVLSGLELVNVRTRFRGRDGQTAENDLDGLFGLPPPGQLFLTATPRDLGAPWLRNLTVGFGVLSLFGFGAGYPKDGPFRTAVTSARLPLLDLKPTVAYRLTDRLSLGLGADVFTLSLLGAAEQKFVSAGLPGIRRGARVKIDGSGTAAGLNASALATLVRTARGDPRLNVAFVWRSQADLSLDGELGVDGRRVASAHSTLHFPDIYTAGLAIWPVRDAGREWKVESDVDYVRWSTIRDLDVGLSNGVTLRNPQHWRDAVTAGIGTQYRWLGRRWPRGADVALRAGYLWSMTPVPDRNFTPAFPDANVHVLAIGAGLGCRRDGLLPRFGDCAAPSSLRRTIGLDLAYQVFLFDPRTVRGNPNPAVNGRYRSVTQALALSLRLTF